MEVNKTYLPTGRGMNYSEIGGQLTLLFQNAMMEKYRYKRLPDEIPFWAIEWANFWNGQCLFFEVGDSYFAQRCATTQALNIYGQPYEQRPIPYNGKFMWPTFRTGIKADSSGVVLKPNAVLIYNNIFRIPTIVLLTPFIKRLSFLWSLIGYNEGVSKLTAVMYGDKDAANSMRKQMKQLIGESYAFPIVQDKNFTTETIGKVDFDIPYRAAEYWVDFDKTFNYLMAFFGVNSKLETKRERLVAGEVGVNEEFIMLNNKAMQDFREDAVERINKMFGLNIELVVTTLKGNQTLAETLDDINKTELQRELLEKGSQGMKGGN